MTDNNSTAVAPASTVGAVANSKCEVASLLSYDTVPQGEAGTKARKVEKKRHQHHVGHLDHNIFKVRKIINKTQFTEIIDDKE